MLIRTFLTCLALCCVSDAVADTPLQIRVLSYNIHHGEGVDRKLDLDRIAGVIRSESPDVVALQEVDQNVSRTLGVDQPATLAKLTGMRVAFGGNIDLQGGHYGNALLTKWPILSHENLHLPSLDNGEQRGVLAAILEVGEPAQLLRIFATHFDHRRPDAERLASAARINQLASKDADAPSILAGDINSTRNGWVLEKLQRYWQIAGSEEQPTIPVADPDRQIDFVMFRPRDRWRVIQTRVLDESIASDHRAILAVLQWLPPAAAPRLPRDNLLVYRSDDGRTQQVNTTGQWQRRRGEILDSMQSVMGWLPRSIRPAAPEVRVTSEVDCGSYVRRLLEYQAEPDGWVPAYLCIPKSLLDDSRRRGPAVLCLHPTDNVIGHDVVIAGLGGKANRQYASELAERGYVTLAPSYPLLAKYQPDLDALSWESGTLKAVFDNMRGIDLLQSLPFVEAGSIGAIGHSLGGHNAVYTSVFDTRIKAIVSSCGLDSYLDYYGGNPAHWVPGQGWTQRRYIPRLSEYGKRLEEIPFDFHEMIAALAPRHTMIIAPLHDGNFRSDSVERVAAAAKTVFQLYGHPQRLRVAHPDCGHDFPPEMREAAYQMFDEALGFD